MFNAWLVKAEDYNKDIMKCFTKCGVPEEAEYIETASFIDLANLRYFIGKPTQLINIGACSAILIAAHMLQLFATFPKLGYVIP
jgi:hypothetical protein